MQNSEMRIRIFLLFFCISSPLLFGRVQKTTPGTVDGAYRPALATVNRFLHAWQTQDHETGIMMLTDAARQSVSWDQLQSFFSPGADAAFEIRRGRRLKQAEYRFRVVLFDSANSPTRPQFCTIVVVRAGKDEWAVDKLP
jgi:hypothetical protein